MQLVRKRSEKFLLWLLLLSGMGAANAWSPQGHGVIALAAVSDLSLEHRTVLHEQARILWQHRANKKSQRYAGRSCNVADNTTAAIAGSVSSGITGADSAKSICFLAYWPDTVRKHSLDKLFRSVGGSVPATLAPFASETTANWHYYNSVYDRRHDKFLPECERLNRGKLAAVLPLLTKAYTEAEANETKAVLLSFIVHLVADAHQPLHAFAASIKHCEHDLGGNRVCLKSSQKKRGKCSVSLHKYWDAGGELFSAKSGYVVGLRPEMLNVGFNVAGWLQESKSLAPQVYSYNPESPLSNAYRNTVTAISDTRVTWAQHRLTVLLEELLSK